MAVVLNTVTQATFVNTSAWTTAVPSGTAVGDLLFFCGGVPIDGGTFNAPAGWAVGQTTETGLDCIMSWAWKVAESGETSGSIAFTWTSTKDGIGLLGRYTGAHATTPINVAPTLLTQASSTTWTSDSINPTTNNCLIVALATNDGNSGHADPQYSSWTFGGSGGTERYDFRDGVQFETMAIADFSQSSAAAISASVTRGNADVGVMGILAIAPAVAGGATEFKKQFISQSIAIERSSRW